MTVQVVKLSGGGIGIYDDADLERTWIGICGERAAERAIEQDVIRNEKFTMPKGTLNRIDDENFELVDEEGRKLTIHTPSPTMAARLIHHETNFSLNSNNTNPRSQRGILVWNAPIRHQFGPIEE